MSREKELFQIISKADHPILVKELIRLLNLHREDRQALKQLLGKMVRKGVIVRTRGRRYAPPQKMDIVIGHFKGHPEGYGFVIPDTTLPGLSEPSDIYIGATKNQEAMHGDQVAARVEKHKAEGKREGRIIRVLERAHTQIVGRLEFGRDFGFVISSDRRITQILCISHDNIQKANEGDIVIAKILSYPKKGHSLEGEVFKVIGRPEDAKIDTETVISSYQLTRHFPAEVMEEVNRVSNDVSSKACAGRRDLRDLPTVTIDGEQAKDFDDAVSIEKRGKGYGLWVHIADVSHYVKAGSSLDQESFLRGTSVYFPDLVLPMLPEGLSNGICSLKPREDRLTLTAEMTFDEKGNLLSHQIYESVIRSDERMTYTTVRQIIEETDQALLDKYAALLPQFEIMDALAKQLRSRRLKRGSLDFDLPEPEIILSLSGETIDIIRGERNFAHLIIEEFMLAANETVAKELSRRNIPFLYRIHDPPTAGRMSAFGDMIQPFGIKLHSEKSISPKQLSEVLKKIKDRPEEKLIHQVLLRAMQQARYSSENRGHFGLASEDYTHFTSPIRRYPDLIVHRILKQVLRSQLTDTEKGKWKTKLPEIARHCSLRERIAVDAEREVIKRKQVNFMVDKVGGRYRGCISGVASYGFFVQLEHYYVEGLVRVSSLYDDYYIFDEKRHLLMGQNRKRIYRLGQTVRVLIDRVDSEHQKIDFKIIDGRRRI